MQGTLNVKFSITVPFFLTTQI